MGQISGGCTSGLSPRDVQSPSPPLDDVRYSANPNYYTMYDGLYAPRHNAISGSRSGGAKEVEMDNGEVST